MADNYQDRPFPADAEHDRAALRDESSLLAKLAQLTGQSDPFGTAAKTSAVAGECPPPHNVPVDAVASAPAGSPPWMQRARQEYEEREYPSPVLPLHRYATASEQDHHE